MAEIILEGVSMLGSSLLVFNPTALSLFDTHAHLDFPAFSAERAEVLARAQKVGIQYLLNPGCCLASSQRAFALAQKFSNVWAAVGLHPQAAENCRPKVLAELKKLARNKKVVALGEIGLDLVKNQNSLEVQIKAFWLQLKLAQKLKLPVIIHARQADREVLEIIDEFPKVRGVVHCFGGDPGFARAILARGFYLGFTGICTFPKAVDVQATLIATPLKRILLETDAPFLAPQARRGQRNEPSFLVEILKQVAELKKVSKERVAKVTTKNALELFQISS